MADSINDAPLISDLKTAILKGEFFVWQKFRDFIEEFLPDEFWQPDELHPTLPGMSTITKDTLRRFLREAYDARSKFAHTGRPFPAHVEIGVADRVRVEAMHEMMALTNSTRFVPLFVWFERLTHLVLREYLYRVIAPELEECRARRREARKEVVEVIEDLPDEARSSLERLTRWTMQFLGMAIIGPHAPNRVWASSEASIETLLGAGLIEGDSASMDGHSWIKDRYVGEAVGEFFFGAEQNPLLGNTLLHPALRKD